MNCANWEERIALYMGGDLGRDESAEVARHLAECAGCRLFASGVRESLAVLREAHGEPLNDAAFAAVRARVVAELEYRPARQWWLWMGAAAAAAALLLAMLWMRPVKRQAPRHEMASRQIEIPVPAVPREPSAVPVVRVHRRRVRRAPELIRQKAEVGTRKPEEPLVVKLMTDDPDVVIYWITDRRGE